MDLPGIIDVANCAKIGALVIMIIQYIKGSIPEKLVPVASILMGIGASFLIYYKVPIVEMDWVVVIANGIIGAIMADTGYSFVSNRTSPTFTLPSKMQQNNCK